MFPPGGRRTRRLTDFLRKRTRTAAAKRPELDCKSFPQLFRKRGVVFTDTADFTLRTARDGILHFLMVFDTVAALAEKVVRRTGGEMVKVEGDSRPPLRMPPTRVSKCSSTTPSEGHGTRVPGTNGSHLRHRYSDILGI